MDFLSVYHVSDSNYAYAISSNTIELRLRVKRNDDIKKVECIYNTTHYFYLNQLYEEMKIKYNDEFYSYYVCILTREEPMFSYLFKITYGNDEIIFFTGQGFKKTYDFTVFFIDSFRFACINEADIIKANPTFEGDVFYEIFPERFNNGDRKNEKKHINRTWDSTDLKGNNFIGGDLKGITQKLDYLKDLGIDAIYLTPIHPSISYHKYDVINYFDIDPQFGTKKDFLELVNQAHERKIKIIMDLVFNHTSKLCPLFQDVIKKGKKSKYYNFYFIKDDKVDTENRNYLSFADVKMMPKLNSNNYAEMDYFLKVALFYVRKFHVDGYRLDVANEVSHVFWQYLKFNLKKEKNDIILIGECWNDAYSFLSANEWDSTMNYQFLDICSSFFAKNTLNPKGFSDRLNNLLMCYKGGSNQMMFNLLDCHDTERFYNKLKNKDKYFLSLATLMFYQGMPLLYYGDEIFMVGGNDPNNRKGMEWNSKEFLGKDFEFVKKIISIRKIEAIRKGDMTIKEQDGIVYIEREYMNDIYTLAINNLNETKKIIVNNVILSNNYVNEILEPFSFVIYKN